MTDEQNLVIDNREPIGQKANGKRRQDIRKFLDEFADVHYGKPVALIAGDYKLWDCHGISHYVTRKSSDFAASLMDGHFSDEFQKILDDPDFQVEDSVTQMGYDNVDSTPHSRIFFLLEGAWAGISGGSIHMKKQGATILRAGYTCNTSIKTLHHAQISVSTAGVEILHTADLRGTASMLAALVDRASRGWPTKITQRLRRPQPKQTSDVKVQRLMAIWPSLRETAAVALLDKYGSIGDILRLGMDAPGTLLGSGVGAKGIENLREVLQ